MSKIYQKMYLENNSRSKGVLGGFIHKVILRSCNSESHPLSFKQTGFTLIELLVVVLIIGILAAVALPQYELAVEKSRSAEPLTVLKTLRDAQEVYFLSNGSYADDLSKLDVSIEPQNKYWKYDMQPMSISATRVNVPDSRKYMFAYRFSQGRKNGMASVICRAADMAYGSEEFAERLCKSLGGIRTDKEAWVLVE